MRLFGLINLFLVVFILAGAQKKLTLEDLFQKGTFSEKTVRQSYPMNDGSHFTLPEGGTKIVKYNCQTGKKEAVVFDIDRIKDAPFRSFSDFEFSEDESKILFTTAKEKKFRYSFSAEYYIWNSVTEELLPLSGKGRQQLATFSADGEKIAFVRENNLYIKNLKFGTESQVTRDGSKSNIINGAPDWVYEEEFGFNKAFAWSPDSRLLAFIRFDESEVREIPMIMFKGEQPSLDESALYPRVQSLKYPKAGEKGAYVSVKIYDSRSKATITADIGKENDLYIPRIKWTPDGSELVIMRMNRRQNQLDILYANPNTGDSRLIFSEKNERYIEQCFLDQFMFLPDGKFVVNSERNGFYQLYLHDRQGFEIGPVTKGDFDVTALYGFDPVRKFFYYQAAAESPMRREVYYISADGKKKGKLSTMQGTNSALFSKGFNYYLNFFSGIDRPTLVTIHDWKGKQTGVIEGNEALIKLLTGYAILRKEFFSFRIPDGTMLNGWILKPPGFNPAKKYPVVITQYSGPDSQEVTDKWDLSWNEFLAQEGFLVVCTDPRGTGARGEDFRKIVYLQLGRYESDDMVETARYLAGLPYVDSRNIGIWGWSYGGFMAVMAMEKGGDLFKAGIAVAPVTSWRFYDNIYTERYMRTPDENPTGYDQCSPLGQASKIAGHLLLIHGSGDDNVHLQNTMEFSEALVQAAIPFDMAVYTNRDHSLMGGNTRLHLYKRMTRFLQEQLMGSNP